MEVYMNDIIPQSRLALMDALWEALNEKPLSRVTVSELAAAANISRQTFYSHFSNVYELAEWGFHTEVTDRIVADASYADWADCFLMLLNFLKENREITYSISTSLSNDSLAEFFMGTMREVMVIIVDEIGADLKLTKEDLDFVITHYTLAVVSHLMHWLATGMAQEPFKLASNLEFILNGTVRPSLERFANRAH